MRRQLKSIVAAVAIALHIVPPAIAIDLVTNGSFENNGGLGQLGAVSSATGWVSDQFNNFGSSEYGYNLIGNSTADTTALPVVAGGTPVKLYGPGGGYSNGFGGSPDGGYFIVAAGGYGNASFYQNINGLTPGNQYTLDYLWAGAQEVGYNGDTTQYWNVSLGSESYNSPIVNVTNHGFSGWQTRTETFTPTTTSALLTFLAVGNPSGLPPMLLLDGVKLTPVSVPEPSTMALGGFATLLVGLMARRKRCRQARA